jgi:hypothetical protein
MFVPVSPYRTTAAQPGITKIFDVSWHAFLDCTDRIFLFLGSMALLALLESITQRVRWLVFPAVESGAPWNLLLAIVAILLIP